MLLLSKLAVHYYRPDFTEGQARSLISDLVEDLADFTVSDVEDAIKAYRQAPPAQGRPKYFPDSGTLRHHATAARRERLDRERAPVSLKNRDSRPLMWWCQSKQFWKPHWREEDIPRDHQAQYYVIKAKRAAKDAA